MKPPNNENMLEKQIKEELHMILFFIFISFHIYMHKKWLCWSVSSPTNPTKVQVILHSSTSSFVSLVDIHTHDYDSG